MAAKKFIICQKTKQGTVMGRNGLYANKEVEVWSGGDLIYFDCIGKLGHTLNAGFSMDLMAFDELIEKLIALRENDYNMKQPAGV